MTALSLEQSIHDSLDNAVTNGYAPNEWRVEEIVMDLQRCDAEGEKHSTETLDPIVRLWLANRESRITANTNVAFVAMDNDGFAPHGPALEESEDSLTSFQRAFLKQPVKGPRDV